MSDCICCVFHFNLNGVWKSASPAAAAGTLSHYDILLYNKMHSTQTRWRSSTSFLIIASHRRNATQQHQRWCCYSTWHTHTHTPRKICKNGRLLCSIYVFGESHVLCWKAFSIHISIRLQTWEFLKFITSTCAPYFMSTSVVVCKSENNVLKNIFWGNWAASGARTNEHNSKCLYLHQPWPTRTNQTILYVMGNAGNK